MADDDTRFAACLDIVLEQEGGFADNKNDPGGATNLGITRKTLARWRGVNPWWNLSVNAVKALGRDEAARIYRASFWQVCRADELPAGLDLALFDYAVNSGPDRAIKALQKLIGSKADGRVGPLTLRAVAESVERDGAGALIADLCDARLGFLKSLSIFTSFGRGWTRRIAAVRAAGLCMAGVQPVANSVNQRRAGMDFLNGYKTYVIAAAMLIAGLAQILGIDLPATEGHSGMQMILEAFGIAFLRQSIRTEINKA